jgi:hypothetical protein
MIETAPVVRLKRQKRARECLSGSVPLLVPHEVVDYGGLDRDCSCRKIVEVQAVLQKKQRGELHHDADSTDKVKAQPTNQLRGRGQLPFFRFFVAFRVPCLCLFNVGQALIL